MSIRREILFKILDKHEISYDKDTYIDDDERAFDAIEEAMQLYSEELLTQYKKKEAFFKNK
jgi:hypothetical protein